MHEWELLIFTMCIPASIGGFLFLSLIHKKIAASGLDPYKVMKLPLLVLAGLSVVGLVASFFHLGTPTHALYTIMGFGRSWMSNEIVFTGIFIGLACVTVGLAILKKKINPLFMLVTGIVGLIDVYCMASAYTSTLVSGWNALNTYTAFFGTVFVLGPVMAASLMAPVLSAEGNKEAGTKIVKTALVIAFVGVAVQAIGVALYGTIMPEVNMINGINALSAIDGYQSTVVVRWIIELFGLGLLGYLSRSTAKVSFSFVYVAVLVLVVAEGMNRYVFYVMGS
ncbi:MAG: dimethyl sulfoxide reductase anchor subunit [Bacillus sp. (in: Bacteria)]|nr:dimethyl sulfoxide reductase anchor subunit [Bacillus sp. (in: firmicutes)]